jgi:methyl-accepting chemotaxis protein
MNSFIRTSLKFKLIFLTLFLSLFTVIAGGIGINYLQLTIKNYTYITNNTITKLFYADDMASSFKSILSYTNYLAVPGTTKENQDSARKKIEGYLERYEKDNKAYLDIPFTGQQKEYYDSMNSKWNTTKLLINKILELDKSDKKADQDFSDKLIAIDLENSASEFIKLNEELVKYHESRLEMRKENAMKDANSGIYISIIVALGSVFFALIIGYIFSNLISKNLQTIADNLFGSSKEVSSSSTQIAVSSEQLSQATTEQAASLQETSSSIEEISAMINSNTENAKQSTTISDNSLKTAEKGKVVVGQMIQAIGEINESNMGIMAQIDETNKEIEKIVQIINEIGNKTKVINDIVFQTKLLSFNASVEAARAGEQGKGFAVVAEEVGNLASMSGTAALEITSMLNQSTKTVENIISDSKRKIGILVSNGKEKVETGTKIANECEQVLIEIVSSVERVSAMVKEISKASVEQASGVQEVTKAISQIDHVTQQNSKNSAESASAAHNLKSQATLLNVLMQNLAQTIHGAQVSEVKKEVIKEKVVNKKIEIKTKEIKEPQIKVATSKTTPEVISPKTVKVDEKAKPKKEILAAKDIKTKAVEKIIPAKGNEILSGGLPSNDDSRFQDV